MGVTARVFMSGTVREWQLDAPPGFNIIDLLRRMARTQAQPISLSTLNPSCLKLTQILGLRMDDDHVWKMAILGFNNEVRSYLP